MKSYAERLARLRRTPRTVSVRTICTHCGAEATRRIAVTRALSGYTCGQCRKQGYLRPKIGGKR